MSGIDALVRTCDFTLIKRLERGSSGVHKYARLWLIHARNSHTAEDGTLINAGDSVRLELHFQDTKGPHSQKRNNNEGMVLGHLGRKLRVHPRRVSGARFTMPRGYKFKNSRSAGLSANRIHADDLLAWCWHFHQRVHYKTLSCNCVTFKNQINKLDTTQAVSKKKRRFRANGSYSSNSSSSAMSSISSMSDSTEEEVEQMVARGD